MIARQIPAPQVFSGLQSVPGAEMSPQCLPSEAAFEADDVIMLHGPPDRHRRGARHRHRRRFSEIAQSLLHRGDQGRQLLG